MSAVYFQEAAAFGVTEVVMHTEVAEGVVMNTEVAEGVVMDTEVAGMAEIVVQMGKNQN